MKTKRNKKKHQKINKKAKFVFKIKQKKQVQKVWKIVKSDK
jgi:hypothetical protein